MVLRIGAVVCENLSLVIVIMLVKPFLSHHIKIVRKQLIIAPSTGNSEVCHRSNSKMAQCNPASFKFLKGRWIVMGAIVENVIRPR